MNLVLKKGNWHPEKTILFQLAQLIVEIETKENQQLKKGEATARAKKGTKALAQWATNLSFECCLKQAFPSICKPRSVETEPMFLRKEEQRAFCQFCKQTDKDTNRQAETRTDRQTNRLMRRQKERQKASAARQLVPEFFSNVSCFKFGTCSNANPKAARQSLFSRQLPPLIRQGVAAQQDGANTANRDLTSVYDLVKKTGIR